MSLERGLLVQDALDRLIKGRTSFIIAHRLSTVVGAYKILVLKDGQADHRIRQPRLAHEAGRLLRLPGEVPVPRPADGLLTYPQYPSAIAAS